QDPEQWWDAVAAALAELQESLPGGTAIHGIGLAGQMHGLVVLDKSHTPLRPAITWSDARSSTEVDSWRAEVGDDLLEQRTGFRAASGMAGVSLTWLRRNEPDRF